MVSEDSSSHSNILHQFIFSNSIPNQETHFMMNHHFSSYGTDSVPNTPYPLNNQSLGERVSRSIDLESDLRNGRPLMDLLGASNETAHQRQRLSLSLGSVPKPSALLNPNCIISGEPDLMAEFSFPGTGFAPFPQPCSTSYGSDSFVGSSKYLKPAQALLEEMAKIGGKEIDLINQKLVEKLSPKGSFGLSTELKAELSNSDMLSEKHGNYINLLKLLSVLEELERRYEEYYRNLEELVSSFEAVAGLGAGKSYTGLALQAMSKHFASLRKAILSQIRVAKQKMAKDMPQISSRLSQLSLFDQEGRQSRVSLQQLGIMQNSRHAWRPIRGLPENSVTILRAWLFEHFLHPYPNDSEKLMLASETGLSKNQVSNWFINARVRLWKPMIEEMYKEEFAESSTESDQLVTAREGVGDSTEDFD